MPRVSIIGLGWLGKPLAEFLLKKGFEVKGSTTSAEKAERLKKEGIPAFQFRLQPYPQGLAYHSLFESDIIFINIPPRSRSMPETYHPEQIKFLKEMIAQAGVKKVIYVSSTSVYPDLCQIAKEEDFLDEENTGNKALLTAEKLLAKDKVFDLTIIRYGGLLGVDRIPGRYFSGKENVDGNAPVNYIHQEDAVSLASWIIEKDLWNETFNGVAPFHPSRREVFEKNAVDMGFPPPKSYSSEDGLWKEIAADKILATGFRFKFSDPLDFSYRLQ
ncbi:NAD(P)-binding domain-containing protein [Cecembia calidifontis]|jgi:nucleoside-diphosphate-sugar epimerase|uniref:Nucleoside-diphosphate-sugar epimerase n=1 Tax=Cecembia calidifontis TaxID=1187080 RepID=A0A4Q7P7D6_9BACT|nr:NAD(P)H-binding protein [Cecembia calidifontis]RZS95945.1 nucleoside-diphosphate-sugar epimerase [Cecembia calidifontis]